MSLTTERPVCEKRIFTETLRANARVLSLRGPQTADADGSIRLLFLKLQDGIAGIEETLARIFVEPFLDVPSHFLPW